MNTRIYVNRISKYFVIYSVLFSVFSVLLKMHKRIVANLKRQTAEARDHGARARVLLEEMAGGDVKAAALRHLQCIEKLLGSVAKSADEAHGEFCRHYFGQRANNVSIMTLILCASLPQCLLLLCKFCKLFCDIVQQDQPAAQPPPTKKRKIDDDGECTDAELLAALELDAATTSAASVAATAPPPALLDKTGDTTDDDDDGL